MRVVRTASREEAMRKAIQELNARLREVRGMPALFMVSGGSALELLEGIHMRNIGKHITLCVLDERYSTDSTVHNFSQIAQTQFYKKAEKKGIDSIDTRAHRGITFNGLANKFERGLKRWRKKYPKGKIIITQGIGQDGHTAGIMPYPENSKKFQTLFEDKNRWTIGYNATRRKTKYPLRITVNLPFLRNQVDSSVVYATLYGDIKQQERSRSYIQKYNGTDKSQQTISVGVDE